jgi:hypothetical protein
MQDGWACNSQAGNTNIIIGEKTSWELPAGRLRRSWKENTKTVVR